MRNGLARIPNRSNQNLEQNESWKEWPTWQRRVADEARTVGLLKRHLDVSTGTVVQELQEGDDAR